MKIDSSHFFQNTVGDVVLTPVKQAMLAIVVIFVPTNAFLVFPMPTAYSLQKEERPLLLCAESASSFIGRGHDQKPFTGLCAPTAGSVRGRFASILGVS